jgi:hypothetical protein
MYISPARDTSIHNVLEKKEGEHGKKIFWQVPGRVGGGCTDMAHRNQWGVQWMMTVGPDFWAAFVDEDI